MLRYVPAATSTPTQTVASLEKRWNATRSCRTSASWTSPPTQSIAAQRCSQSATDSAVVADEWPESESPDARPIPSTNAAHSNTRRSVSHAEHECGDEREAELHRDERLAEARTARDRRQVAVEERGERQLQRILGTQQERSAADLERDDVAGVVVPFVS